MDELTETQRLIRDTVRDLARKEFLPRAARLDETGEFPWENFRRLAELGLTGIPLPEEYGGAGADTLSFALALEEIAKVCGSTCLTLAAHTSLGTMPIFLFGSEELRRRYVPPNARGETIGSYGLTEPGAGSDSGGTQTTAVPAPGGWKINGSKIFMTNASVAGVMTITAVTDRDAEKHARISAFVLEPSWKGVTVARKEDKLGIRASSTCELILDDVRVPAGSVLGQPGQGYKVAMEALNVGRIGIAAQMTGLAAAALQHAIDYAKQRKQFGQPLINFQITQWKLGQMAQELEASRLLTWKAAWKVDRGEPATIFSSMAKAFATDTAMRATTEAVQMFGGYGYIKDFPVEKLMRDAKVLQIYEGSNEIQRLVIAEILAKAEGSGAPFLRPS